MSAPAIVSRALARSGLIPLDAKVLLGHVLGRDRAWLAAHGDATLTREQLAAFESLTRRRQWIRGTIVRSQRFPTCQ